MAMESLVIEILDQIALEGPQGCSVAHVWQLLETSAVVIPLTDSLKQLLWDCLLQKLPDIQICQASEPCEQGGRPEGRTKNRKQRQAEEAAPAPLESDEVKETFRDFQDAEEQDLHVVASEALRDAVLGLHDALLSSFAISAPQRKALEAIARARQTGVLRSELAKQCGLEAKNFHYVVRALEARSLITSQNINVKANGSTNRITTSILHLPRFKLNVMPGLIKEAEAGKFVVEDEEGELRRICSCVAGAPGGVMMEPEVKRVLGFVGTQGHRRWRRFKKMLVDTGRLSEFVGLHSDACVNFLRVEKALPAAQVSSAGKEDKEAAEPEADFDTVAELGFDDQVINLVLESGSEGIPKHKLATRLGMTNKRATKLMHALCERVGIRETDEQQGRMQMKVWRAPEELLRQHQLSHAPAVPPGGWRAAVAAAAAAGPELAGADQPASVATPPTRPSVQGMLTSVPVTRAAAPLAATPVTGPADAPDAPAPFEFPEIPSVPDQAEAARARSGALAAGPSTVSMPVIGAEQPGSAASGGQESGGGLVTSAAAAVSGDIGMPTIEPTGLPPLVQSGTIQILGETGTAVPDQKMSTLTLQRQQRLVEHVMRDGFMMVSDVPSFFQEMEVGMNTGLCDVRTRNRIIDRCLAAGQLMRLLVQLPGRRVKHRSFQVELLARSGTPLDFTFLNEVRECAHRRRAERHRRANPAERAKRLRAEGVALPVVDLPPAEGGAERGVPVRPGARGGANLKAWNTEMEALVENGYLRSRMVRVRLLHYFICRLVGLGGNERSDADLIKGYGPPNAALESSGKDKEADLNLALQTQMIQIKELANLRPGQAPAPTSTALEADGREGRRLTLKGLWDAMPMAFFFQVVGCGVEKAEAEKLCAEDKRMGELDQSMRDKVSTVASCNRLRDSLDTMRRIGLLEKEARPDQARQGQGPASGGVVYVAQPSAQLELPSSISQEGGSIPGAVQPGGLRVLYEYDFRQKAKVDEYWARLEFASLTNPVAMRYCWPAKRAPEVVSPQGWQMLRLMSAAQARHLRERLAAQVGAGLDWVACQRIATDLKLSYTQVMRIAAQYRSRERLERLKTGAQPLPRLIKTKAGLGTLTLGPERQHPKPPAKLPGGRKRDTAEEKRRKARDRARASREKFLKEIDMKLQQRAAAKEVAREEDSEEVVPRRRERKMHLTYEEDRTLLCALVRWHAVHGVGLDKQCFRGSRRLLPDYHLLETQAARRIGRLMTNPKTKESLEKLLALAGEVHARAAWRAAVSEPAVQRESAPQPAADSNRDAVASAGQPTEPSAATEAASEEAPGDSQETRKGVPKGTQLPGRRLDPQAVMAKGAAVGDIVRRLADGAAAPADNCEAAEAAHAPPRKRQRKMAAAPKEGMPPANTGGPPPSENGGTPADTDGNASGHGNRGGMHMEELYKQRMAAIGEAMKEGPLFKVVSPEDAAALKDAEALVEEILAAAKSDKKMSLRPSCRRPRPPAFPDGAPMLPKEKRAGKKRKAPAGAAGAPASRPKRQRTSSAPAALKRAAAGGDAGPDVAAAQLSMAISKGRTLVQQWRSAVGRHALNKHLVLPAGTQPPSTSVAVAMELIKSLLLVAEASPQETPTPDAATALVRRFSQAEITEAFGYLRKAGHVNHGASNRPFHLSDAFMDSLQVVDFPPEIFVEVRAARDRLRAAKLLQQPPSQPQEGAVLEFAADEEVPSGMVAESLSLLAAGELDIRPHNVKVNSAEAGGEEDPMIGPLSVRIPLRITRGPPPQSASHPPSQPPPPVSLSAQQARLPQPQKKPQRAASEKQQTRSGVADRRDAPLKLPQQERVFWPHAVAANFTVRSTAEASCTKEWAGRSGVASPEKSLMKKALRLVREAGADGLTVEQLSSSAKVSAEVAQELLEAALHFGLARRVGGYMSWAYVASEHTQRFLPDGAVSQQTAEADAMQPPAEDPASADAQQQSSSKGGASQQQGGAPEGADGEGTLLQPWADHRGRLNKRFLRSLTQRAVSVVIRLPGIPEDLLVEELEALSPHSARRLLAMLLADGLITARFAEGAPAPQPPGIFRRLHQQPPPEPKVVKHYFPNLSSCFGRTAETLPVADDQAI